MKTPSLSDVAVDVWVQGGPIALNDLVGSVVLIEIFQVNCPGCFLYSLPSAVEFYEKYHHQGLEIIGLATAFEDYDKNTLDNLKKLINDGEVIGQTYKALNRYDKLTEDRKLPWKIPFPVGMDRVTEDNQPVTDERVLEYAQTFLTGFNDFNEGKQHAVLQQVRHYLEQKTKKAETFERFALQGTPSCITFDRTGNLRDISFGQIDYKQTMIEELLANQT
ncbi:MAG: TlpA family protein disulfide reductase [Nitrosomonas sp.]